MANIRIPLGQNGADGLELAIHGTTNPSVDLILNGKLVQAGAPWRDLAGGRPFTQLDGGKTGIYMPTRFTAQAFSWKPGEQIRANNSVCFFYGTNPAEAGAEMHQAVYLGLEKRKMPEPRCGECKAAHSKKAILQGLVTFLTIMVFWGLFFGLTLIPGVLDRFEAACVLIPPGVIAFFTSVIIGNRIGSSPGDRILGPDRKDASCFSPAVRSMILANREIGPIVDQDWRKTRRYQTVATAENAIINPGAGAAASAVSAAETVASGIPGTIRCPSCSHDNPAWRSSCEKCSAVIRTVNVGTGNPTEGKTGSKNVQAGIARIAIGITLTAASYMFAPTGGTYYIFWGPILYGIYLLSKGKSQTVFRGPAGGMCRRRGSTDGEHGKIPCSPCPPRKN